jgi:hypothetical protein
MERVRFFLDDRRLLTVDLVLVGPEYVRIEIAADVAVASDQDAGAVESAVTEALKSFLHPLTGGPDGTGWDFGRLPKESDVYGLIHKLSGVDHVRTLEVKRIGERFGAESTGRFLICPGECRVSVVA